MSENDIECFWQYRGEQGWDNISEPLGRPTFQHMPYDLGNRRACLTLRFSFCHCARFISERRERSYADTAAQLILGSPR